MYGWLGSSVLARPQQNSVGAEYLDSTSSALGANEYIRPQPPAIFVAHDYLNVEL